jgi:hypothetical protein
VGFCFLGENWVFTLICEENVFWGGLRFGFLRVVVGGFTWGWRRGGTMCAFLGDLLWCWVGFCERFMGL